MYKIVNGKDLETNVANPLYRVSQKFIVKVKERINIHINGLSNFQMIISLICCPNSLQKPVLTQNYFEQPGFESCFIHFQFLNFDNNSLNHLVYFFWNTF